MTTGADAAPAVDDTMSTSSTEPSRRSTGTLRAVLALIGAFITIFGLNMALGGIETLGWEGRSDFVDVTDREQFDVQDNHVRFVSGVWTAIGLVFLAATRWLHQLRLVLVTLLAMIFLGGLARFSSGSVSLITGADLIGSITAELVLTPLLAWWVLRSTAPGAPEPH